MTEDEMEAVVNNLVWGGIVFIIGVAGSIAFKGVI